ncbi:glutamate receptor ionotropic, NMDA 1-like [Centruroides sculpturatus]|uniref:glutamate receptor ionotropic, NMDA 1-like n=1 Tax=Centruroides sculpturatus TaxID=218467 RepID=UPI000C6D8894|nr:glutamate receptor ionotropic, NMDA 1-like [Centruroides sculpturatus]
MRRSGLLVLILFCSAVGNAPVEVAIGAIFPSSPPVLEETFRLAINNINSDSNLLPNTKLIPITENASTQLELIRAVCNLVDQRVISIVVPLTSFDSKIAQTVCGQLGIPQISILATDPMLSLIPILNQSSSTLLKMSPPDTFQNHALIHILKYYGWDAFAILTEDNEAAIHATMELQRLATKYEITLLSIQRFPLSDSKSLNITSQLNDIKEKDVRIIILYCSITISKTVINQADRMNMFRSGWIWLVMDSITSFSFTYLSDNDGYVPSSLVGLIGTAIVVPDTILYLKLPNQLKEKNLGNQLENEQAFTRVYDAVLAIANGLHRILYEEKVSFELPTFQKGSCADSVNEWKRGRNLLESILNLKNVNGSLGPLKFTKFGYHHLTSFDIENLQMRGFVKVGKWLEKEKSLKINSEIIFPGQTTIPPNESHHRLFGRTLNIGIILDEPFIMKNPYYKEGDPMHSKYEGLLIDLLLKLQEIHDFKFELHETKEYGNKNEETKKWNGIVKQLMDKKIDLALATLTISWKRQQVITFTAPYYDLGLAILMPKYNAKTNQNYFAFLSPFETTVWLTIAVSVIFTSLVLAVCVNLTPSNFDNRKKEIGKANQSVGDSSSFTFPPLPDVLPIAI